MINKFIKNFFDIKFWKFVAVGVLNTLVGTGVMFLLYNLAGFSYWLASAANYIVGSIVSYFLNKYFTFRSRESGKRTLWRFALNIVVCWLLAYGAAKPDVRALLSEHGGSLQDNVAMAAGACVFIALNYVGQRFFVFRDKADIDDGSKT